MKVFQISDKPLSVANLFHLIPYPRPTASTSIPYTTIRNLVCPWKHVHTTGNFHSKFSTFMCCLSSPSFTTKDLDRKISTLHLKIYTKLKHILTFCELEILTNAQPPTHSFTNAMVKNGF